MLHYDVQCQTDRYFNDSYDTLCAVFSYEFFEQQQAEEKDDKARDRSRERNSTQLQELVDAKGSRKDC